MFLHRRESDTSVHSAASETTSPAAFQAPIGQQQQQLLQQQLQLQQQSFAFPSPTTGALGGGRLGHAPSSLLQAASLSSSSSTLSTASMPPTLFGAAAAAAGGGAMGLGGGALCGLEADRSAGAFGSIASLNSPLSMTGSAASMSSPMDLSSHTAAGFGGASCAGVLSHHNSLSLTFQHQFAAAAGQSPFAPASVAASAASKEHSSCSGSKKLRTKEQMLCAVCGDVASVLTPRRPLPFQMHSHPHPNTNRQRNT